MWTGYRPFFAEYAFITVRFTELLFDLNPPCRLKNMENTNHKKLQALRNSGAENIFEAYKWVQEHRHEFNKEVFGPVLLEVQ